jgi:hypothetical protein
MATCELNEDPRAEYERRIAALDVRLASGARRHLLASNLRLAVFAALAAIAWLAFAPGVFSPVILLIPALAFCVLLIVHARILNANDRALRARRYCERGLDRLDGSWMGTGADGARFLEHHPYARDLDLFGPGSLFQLLATARTEAGEETLAKWLSRSAARAETLERQVAVEELRSRLGFREMLAVAAAEARVSRAGSLSRWASAQSAGLGLSHAVLFSACATGNVIVVTAALGGWLSPLTAAGWLAVAGGVARYHRRAVWQVIRGTDAVADDLSLFQSLLEQIERESFAARRLTGLRGALDGRSPASVIVARLRRAIAARDAVRNEFVRPFGVLLFVRSLAAVATDEWHRRHHDDLRAWIDAVAEFEAFSSLATYAFEHPSDPFPDLVDGRPRFDAEAIAHPLLPEQVAVRNDVHIGGDGAHLLVVSGSNMSGKSTLLRAVGINAVLAMAGAPVRARSLTLSPLRIGASIRVDDSLQEGHSRFYSEILRIRDIVETATAHQSVLFLLDEILHGTNSHDRRTGADAIVHALLGAGAIGMITTHDLALTTLADAPDVRARNVHFEDRVVEGRMVFDYRMRDGVVERSNALELMRAVGLKV